MSDRVRAGARGHHPAGARAETEIDLAFARPDTLPWSSAQSRLPVAGWNLVDRPDSEAIRAKPGGLKFGQLLARRPASQRPVDGHGLLRKAQGGNLPVTGVLFDARITSVFGLAVTSPGRIRKFIAEPARLCSRTV